ncbi:MAG: transporter substrate-binding protein [Paenibacillus sp.]|nr:transporter substrate-binding protein [Paenibacillus sp.]
MAVKNVSWKLLGICGAVVLVTSCGVSKKGGEESPAANNTASLVPAEPVTIKFLSSLADSEFDLLFRNAMKKKYPNITIEVIKKGAGSQLTDILAAGTIPDLVLDDNTNLGTSAGLGVFQDHTALSKRHNIDLNRIEPVVLDAIRNATADGALYGLPYFIQVNGLYYNKEIFNRFGVPYPSDGMTWNDAIQLAKRLTRDGYKGLHYEKVTRIAESMSPDYVDRKTNKATVNTDAWREIFTIGQQILSIPGNMPPKIENGYRDDFFKAQNFAMLATINVLTAEQSSLEGGFPLGVAQYPSLPGKPNTYGYVSTGMVYVTKQSKHQDAAMLVLKEMVSDETQIESARKLGRFTVLKSAEAKQQFGKDLPFLKNLDLTPLSKSLPAPGPAFSAYSAKARQIVQDRYVDFINQKYDLNTALRTAEEEINLMVAAELSK